MKVTVDSAVPFFQAVLATERAGRGFGELVSKRVAAQWAGRPAPEAPVIERKIFKAWIRQHESAGLIYGAEVSKATGLSRGAGKYELGLVARSGQREAAEALQVFSVLYVCSACVAVGTDYKGNPCPECGGSGWDDFLGEPLGAALGDRLEVVRLRPPSTSLYLDAWQA